MRLDLNENPVEEATRCLDAGARGIKLHPRAQKISLEDERLTPVFQLAAERKVPILIHGGRGLPPIAAHLHALVERCAGVQLIVAHAGIADMANLTARFAGSAGRLLRHLGVERRRPARLLPADAAGADRLRVGLSVRAPAELAADGAAHGAPRRLRRARDRATCSSGNATRIANGEPPLEPTTPKGGDELTQPTIIARIHQYLSMATPLMWTRQPDSIGVLGLALNTMRLAVERLPRGDRADPRAARDGAGALVAALEEDEEAERIRSARFVSRLTHLADILAVTAHA